MRRRRFNEEQKTLLGSAIVDDLAKENETRNIEHEYKSLRCAVTQWWRLLYADFIIIEVDHMTRQLLKIKNPQRSVPNKNLRYDEYGKVSERYQQLLNVSVPSQLPKNFLAYQRWECQELCVQ